MYKVQYFFREFDFLILQKEKKCTPDSQGVFHYLYLSLPNQRHQRTHEESATRTNDRRKLSSLNATQQKTETSLGENY